MYMTKVRRGDLAGKWALPDRVFFACGACHILAYAAVQRFPQRDFKATWIKPRPGYTGNHIVAVSGRAAFDYHGFSDWRTLLNHMSCKAARRWPGWDAELIALPPDAPDFRRRSREPLTACGCANLTSFCTTPCRAPSGFWTGSPRLKFHAASSPRAADIRLSPRYINLARHVRAFRVAERI